MSENTCTHCGKPLHWVNRPDGWVLIHSDDGRSIHGCTNAPPLAPATGSPNPVWKTVCKIQGELLAEQGRLIDALTLEKDDAVRNLKTASDQWDQWRKQADQENAELTGESGPENG